MRRFLHPATRVLQLATFVLLALFAATLAACGAGTGTPAAPTAAPPTATPTAPATDHVVIAQVMAGVTGDNNHDYIVLFNPTGQIADLQGWALWYRLNDQNDPQLLYRWQEHALVPPGGYYLLAHTGEDVGLAPDATFDLPIVPPRGGLQLRATDGTPIDSVAWGSNGPASFAEGQPAPGFRNGQALIRRPGGAQGNGQDTDDNAEDFTIGQPRPANTGSPLLAAYALPVTLTWQAPPQATPGETFSAPLVLANTGDQPLENVSVRFPVPQGLQVAEAGEAQETDGVLVWRVPALAPGASAELPLTFQAPWTYLTATASGFYAENQGRYAFGTPQQVVVGGGAIPIGVARTLPQGTEVMVEGIATMYTGGFYAGGSNVKFYVQDDTGGIQIQVFGGAGQVDVPIGARVQVRGVLAVYRGAVQIQPKQIPADIQILTEAGNHEPQPLPVSLEEAASPEMEGRLVTVHGTVTALDEHSYSYTLTLADENGNNLGVYVDKNTQANPLEILETGQDAQITGILEERDGSIQLYPRRQSDIVPQFPPELVVNIQAPLYVRPGEDFTVALTLLNHTDQRLENVRVSLPMPAGAAFQQADHEGQVNAGAVVWEIPALEPQSGKAEVQATFRATASGGHITLEGYQAAADALPQPAGGTPRYVFLGDTVPIWAIQGEGFKSPYRGEELTTEGVVTSVFPGLGGFFIQDLQPDDNPATSEGLFVSIPNTLWQAVGLNKPGFAEKLLGHTVRVTGTVREAWQQTVLELAAANAFTVEAAAPEPQPVTLAPPEDPAEAEAYYEHLEGMLVAAPQDVVAVGPTNRYGETPVVPASVVANLPDGEHIPRGAEDGFLMFVDDGSFGTYTSSDGMPYRATTGDHLHIPAGPLAYTYGAYKIEPLEAPTVQAGEHTLQPLPQTPDDVLSVMTWNTENFFDDREPNPSSPPMPTPRQYHVSVQKVANTIAQAGFPLVVGLEEVENIGVLEDVAATDVLAPWHYQAVLIEGHDSRGIDVGFLIRTDRVEILDAQQYDAPEGLTSRPPLVVHLRVNGGSAPFEVYAIVNHFTSMAGGEKVTEPRRLAQAKWNLEVINRIRETDPQARFIVMGDLNSYFDSPPIDALREGGLVHVMDGMDATSRYTYIYKGEVQTLDHILVTPDLDAQLLQVAVFHADADYPPPPPDDTSPIRKSDHDPVVAWFTLP